MPDLTVAMFTEVVETTCRLVDAVTADQWSAPTPCTEWDVRALTDHLVAGQKAFAEIMTGPAVAGATLGFRASAMALVFAFRQPGALVRVVQVPVGAVPGSVAMHLQTVEHLVHGWDLATATGQTVRFSGDVVEAATEFSRGLLRQVPAGPGGPFEPSQPAPETASGIDRLAALLGRKVA